MRPSPSWQSAISLPWAPFWIREGNAFKGAISYGVLKGERSKGLVRGALEAYPIEATEYPDLVKKFQVRGVPKIVINETAHFEGAMPESDFVARVLQAAIA